MLKVMKENGSPVPQFETDEDRSSFLIRLPVHERAIKEVELNIAWGIGTEKIGGVDKVTPEVTPEVKLIRAFAGEMSRRDLQQAVGLKDDEHFRKVYLLPALDQGLIEMTIPDKPRSSKQRYRLTAKGTQLLEKFKRTLAT